MAINLNMLRYICTIAKTGSFSEAAKILYVSQPYLSQRIQKFENEIGFKVFDRASHPIKVTPAGMCFVEWGHSLELDERNVLGRAQKLSGSSQSSMTIISSRLRNIIFLPKYISELQKRVPDCKVTLKTASSVEKRAEEFSKRNADVLIDMVPYQISSDLISKKIAEERIYLAIPRSHPLCPKEDVPNPINLNQFAGHQFISLLSGMKYYDMLLDACTKNSFYPNIIMEVPDMPTCCSMVAEGMGVAVVPSTFASTTAFSDRVRFLPIIGEDSSNPIFITYYKSIEQTNAFITFMKLLEDNN